MKGGMQRVMHRKRTEGLRDRQGVGETGMIDQDRETGRQRQEKKDRRRETRKERYIFRSVRSL